MNRTPRHKLALCLSLLLLVLCSIGFSTTTYAQDNRGGGGHNASFGDFENQTTTSDATTATPTQNPAPTPEPSTSTTTNSATPQASPPPICDETMNCQPSPTPQPLATPPHCDPGPCIDPIPDRPPITTDLPPLPPLPPAPVCLNTVTANVVALDQVYYYNRFGAFNPAGMIYALRRDVVGSGPGNVQLRAGKRPRPIALRVNEGDCLQVNFTNLLSPTRRDNNSTQTRTASIHVNGLDYVNGVQDDAAKVGRNNSSLAAPGETRTYKWYAAKQGQYLMYSMGAPAGGEGDNGQPGLGLFGSVNVEPKGSKWYRSQVTAQQLAAATVGRNSNGTPRINYDAVDANGDPILRILNQGNEIIHADLNALITDFVEECTDAPPTSICGEPFREFTVLFHDEIKAVQAFPELDKELFHGVRDGFAVNYGASGLGSILLANRKGIGPSKNCKECKFEDFFLESTVNGDPALLVRKDANNVAVEALFPDDPSNVHHSYLGDPVRYRNMHVGKETHVFHLHAHQWLQSPRDDNSTYLDSQTISPGGSYTYEINYGGSGNRNFTPGDSIFHCHLYPHFAQGMWELWRVHDVFEQGTADRNLPDAEIASGVPTPAVVPLKMRPMPPMPTFEFPGYPFYIGGNYGRPTVVGHRPPQPPLDIEWDGGLPRHRILSATVIDGEAAIEPHLLQDPVAQRVLNTYDASDPDPLAPEFPSAADRRSKLLQFARKMTQAKLEFLPQGGTTMEFRAMQFHAGTIQQMSVRVPTLEEPCWYCAVPPNPVCGETANCDAGSLPGTQSTRSEIEPPGCGIAGCQPPEVQFTQVVTTVPVVTKYGWPAKGYPSYTPEGNPGLFLVNGQPPIAGAPFADPCSPAAPLRKYRAAYIQFDMPVNRSGWHDRQARITTLEDDAIATRDGVRKAEPLFFRANSDDCIDFRATNLVPHVLNIDDFQIFTPTDIIGQHIHLVKFDVTSSDGSGNGWNYEDGTFSPGEVQERIEAHNAYPGTTDLHPLAHPKFGNGPDLDHNGVGDYKGAQTTIQRWWADTLLNSSGVDRTIRTVFTHDHFGPSSHQHHGLYGALVVEPTGSQWQTIDGRPMGTRQDGGPTSYAANIILGPNAPTNAGRSFREFNLSIADFAIVYTADLQPVNPPGRKEAPLPIGIEPTMMPHPEAISAADPGTQLVNYRNEPIPHRIAQKDSNNNFVRDANGFVKQKTDASGDMANVFNSHLHGDPFTPMLTAFVGDRVQVRLTQGAQEEQHVFNLHGFKWLFEPSSPNSGYRNGQQIGISEHFEFEVQPMPIPNVEVTGVGRGFRDHLYSSAATDNLWDGQWGIMRVYHPSIGGTWTDTTGLDFPIASLPQSSSSADLSINTTALNNAAGGVCPANVAARNYNVQAWLARDLLPGGALVYYSNEHYPIDPAKKFALKDPNAILFIQSNEEWALRNGIFKPEPLILRAAAGECINVTLTNRLPSVIPEQNSWNLLPMIVNKFNFNQVRTSNRVSLHPQLVSYDPFTNDGAKVGFNQDSTVGPGQSITYTWYAGDQVHHPTTGELVPAPIEFGATNLRDMGDVIKHASHGAIGALIIEPEGSSWTVDYNRNASAYVTAPGGAVLFREHVVLYQDDLSVLKNTTPLKNIGEEDDSEDSGFKAFNYRSEPLWARLDLGIEDVPDGLNDKDQTNVLSTYGSNPGCGGACGDPQTPIFTARAGEPVRFRVLHPAGHPRQHAFTLHGHHWNFEPWVANSTKQGNNPFTFEIGSEGGIGPTRHVNILTTSGGLFSRTGDFLYRTQESFQFSGGGLWGIFRVTPRQ